MDEICLIQEACQKEKMGELAEKSSQAVTNILSQQETEKVLALTVKLTISEGCSKLMTAMSILEGTHRPTAVSAYNV